MGTIAAIVAVVVVLVAIAIFASRGRKTLPPEATSRAPEKPAPNKPEQTRKGDPAPAAPPKPLEEASVEATASPVHSAPTEAEQTEAEAPAEAPPLAEPIVSTEPEPAPAPPAPSPASTPDRTPAKRDGDTVAALQRGLATTRGGFIARLAALFGRRKEIDPSLLDEIQTVLLTADIGPRAADKLLASVRDEIQRTGMSDEDAVWTALKARAREVLGTSPGSIELQQQPTVILVVGVNGVGKTTTIGKLASRFKEDGKKVVLAAGDTFRAAAVTQLEVWGKRVGCEVVKGKERADPSAVIFDAIRRGVSEQADVVIADTAGRLHTKSNLMEELKKVVRSSEKALERPVDEILLVLDATTGQNAVQQVQLFREAIPINGIVLTKLDGTAKGGVILGVADEHSIPVRYVGIGERVEDLRSFEPDTFVEALFSKPPADDDTH